jgi:type 1 fimbria pilin
MYDSKFALVFIASAAMLYFHVTYKREVAAWQAAGTVTSKGVKIAAATCLLWAAVTIGGRLTAYLGSLYLR